MAGVDPCDRTAAKVSLLGFSVCMVGKRCGCLTNGAADGRSGTADGGRRLTKPPSCNSGLTCNCGSAGSLAKMGDRAGSARHRAQYRHHGYGCCDPKSVSKMLNVSERAGSEGQSQTHSTGRTEPVLWANVMGCCPSDGRWVARLMKQYSKRASEWAAQTHHRAPARCQTGVALLLTNFAR